jgi:hypothetical protein
MGDIHEIALEEFARSYLRVFKRTLGPNILLMDKKDVSLPRPGYLLTFRPPGMASLILHFATVNGGIEYSMDFIFPEKGSEFPLSRGQC